MQYRIEGDNLPVLICQLEGGEKMITEKGGMAWMSPNISMETMATGGLKKALGRAISNESMFQNIYTANGAGEIAFTPCLPGSIKVIDVSSENIVAGKGSFLASEASVELSIFFQKKIATGIFGGEGFIMQKMSGTGKAFLAISGSTIEYELAEGQQIVISSGQLAYMSGTCGIDVVSVKGMKNKLLGGEGFFNLVITGPGKVVMQTLTPQDLAMEVAPYVVTTG